jgi:distribution and morphology protein 10
MGFLSSAYSAQVSPTVAISSRFGVNVYSYESDLSVGGEWWIGRKRGKREVIVEPSLVEQRRAESKRAALQEASLREDMDLAEPAPRLPPSVDPEVPEERDGVLKARISGDSVCPPPSSPSSKLAANA